jgi:hypothetical protein
MNKPSERIVVFVTPAQKRAISATADELGISISELMRRAVIAFSATSDQVKAASIVDRLNAPREPDALAQVLRRAARPQRQGRGGLPRSAPAPAAVAVTLAAREDEEAAESENSEESATQAYVQAEVQADTAHDADNTLLHAANGASAEASVEASAVAAVEAVDTTPAPSLPATHAIEAPIGNAVRKIGQAIARLAAEAEDAEAPLSDAAGVEGDEPMQPLSGISPFARTTHPHGDADARHDGQNGGAPEDGKFA